MIYEISPTGNLTIVFNKPIVVPNIRTTSEFVPTRRLLQDELPKKESQAGYEYDIKQVVDLKIESDFYTSDMN